MATSDPPQPPGQWPRPSLSPRRPRKSVRLTLPSSFLTPGEEELPSSLDAAVSGDSQFPTQQPSVISPEIRGVPEVPLDGSPATSAAADSLVGQKAPDHLTLRKREVYLQFVKSQELIHRLGGKRNALLLECKIAALPREALTDLILELCGATNEELAETPPLQRVQNRYLDALVHRDEAPPPTAPAEPPKPDGTGAGQPSSPGG